MDSVVLLEMKEFLVPVFQVFRGRMEDLVFQVLMEKEAYLVFLVLKVLMDLLVLMVMLTIFFSFSVSKQKSELGYIYSTNNISA